MHVDPLLPKLCAVNVALLSIGFVLRKLRLPYILGYLAAGVVLGPFGLEVVTDEALLAHLGALGVVLLLFFVGMEISPDRLLAVWKVSFGGTFLQIVVSVLCVWIVGLFFDWSPNRIILLGFVISLSSTAMVLRVAQRPDVSALLSDRITGILIAQDVAIIPMILILGLLKGDAIEGGTIALQLVGAVIAGGIVVWISRAREVRLGIGGRLGHDRELQTFAALIICFGLSFLTGVLGLSTALGAFLAGMVISAGKETHWIHESLESFRVVFVALFFVSVGMLLDLDFVADHWMLVTLLTLLALGTNTLINAGTLRVFGSSWSDSILGGSILAQIGELSYVLAAIGKQGQIVTDFAYQATVAVITLSLAATPFWVAGAGVLARRRTGESATEPATTETKPVE